MKKVLFFATALLALASCTSDDFTGETPRPTQNGEGAISFGSGTYTVTRDKHADDAALLGSEFIFAGTKGTNPTSFVFDQYTAKYVANSANTTESNSSDWEYVSYTPGTGNTLPSGAVQSIKYWDYSTTQYDFAAYSLGIGTGTPATYATVTKAIAAADKEFKLTGTADQLKACYISDLVTYYNQSPENDYGKTVVFKFRSLATKIRIAFYETIPGYSVQNVQFYESDEDDAADGTPVLYTANKVLPTGSGTMTITYPHTGFDKRPGGTQADTDYNKAHVTFTNTSSNDVSNKLSFDALANFAGIESKEDDGSYLGRTSNSAIYAGGLVSGAGKYYTILPYEDGANLKLRISFELVSTDGSDEVITVDNATAVVPAEFAKWNPNYAYTYIFKISDMTNGTTGFGPDGTTPVYGLTPITLDAVVVDSEDGIQETITTVSNPSITTYAQGKVVTENDEYIAGIPVYIIVNTGTENATLTSKAKLFTVTQTAGANAGANPAQAISESSIDNAYINDTDNEATTWSVTDANGWVLTLTQSDLMSLVNVIDAADSPTGNEITIGTEKVAKFTPSTAGTLYAFQYQVEAPTTETLTPAQYNATLPGAISATSEGVYSFISYADNSGNLKYGEGKVKVVSTANGWTTVLVISNTSTDAQAADFVGEQYKVNATTMAANTFYQLYTTGGAATGIYVKVAVSSIDSTEAETYNAHLTGAVDTDQTVNVPGKYQYKIIKVQ